MNELEYISYRMHDLIDKDSELLNFTNGFRLSDSDMADRKFNPYGLGPRVELRTQNTYETKQACRKNCGYLNHSWEPIEIVTDHKMWNSFFDDRKNPVNGYEKLVVLHSEHSKHIRKLEHLGFYPVHWFSHGLLCSEHWYRLYKDINVVAEYRDITTPWVCVNRLIDNKRSYRIEFLNMLDVNRGTYSLLANDPQTGRSLREIYPENKVRPCSFDDHENTSAWITVNKPTPINSAFLHVVTETVVDRVHLTEKIFKPIVLKQPFVLVGGAGCLKYLKDYGFSTFSRWWSEDYDNIQDTTERMQAVAEIVNWIGKQDRLESLRNQMKETLDYNYHWFYNGFSSKCWDELVKNVAQHQTPKLS